MNFTITFGWWSIPLVITITFFCVAFYRSSKRQISTGGYFGELDLEGLIEYVGAIIASLVVWLIWALLT